MFYGIAICVSCFVSEMLPDICWKSRELLHYATSDSLHNCCGIVLERNVCLPFCLRIILCFLILNVYLVWLNKSCYCCLRAADGYTKNDVRCTVRGRCECQQGFKSDGIRCKHCEFLHDVYMQCMRYSTSMQSAAASARRRDVVCARFQYAELFSIPLCVTVACRWTQEILCFLFTHRYVECTAPYFNVALSKHSNGIYDLGSYLCNRVIYSLRAFSLFTSS